jgi:hypothetical protein
VTRTMGLDNAVVMSILAEEHAVHITAVAVGDSQEGESDMHRRSNIDVIVEETLRELEGEFEGELEGETAAEKRLKYVIRGNRNYRKTLGWDPYEVQITDQLLGIHGQSLSEEQFAKEVARWQANNYIWPADGMLGPDTWARMRQALKL